MECAKITYPLSDNYMVYDYHTHMYYITPDGVMNVLGVNLNEELESFGQANNTTQALRFCKKASQVVYSYIRQGTWSYSYIEYIMAKDGRLRDRIERMLLAQIEYCLVNGFVSAYSGINVAKGTAMRIEDLRDDFTVAKEVVDEVNDILPEYGFCLRTGCKLPQICPHAYELEGY